MRYTIINQQQDKFEVDDLLTWCKESAYVIEGTSSQDCIKALTTHFNYQIYDHETKLFYTKEMYNPNERTYLINQLIMKP